MGMLHNVMRGLKEEQSFYDELKGELDVNGTGDLVMCLGDFNRHAGRHIDGFNEVHRGYGIFQRNLDGRMLLEFCLMKELCVSITWFKRVKKRKMTFRMGENETEIDCVDKERTPMVCTKYEGNTWGVSTCFIGSRCR